MTLYWDGHPRELKGKHSALPDGVDRGPARFYGGEPRASAAWVMAIVRAMESGNATKRVFMPNLRFSVEWLTVWDEIGRSQRSLWITRAT